MAVPGHWMMKEICEAPRVISHIFKDKGGAIACLAKEIKKPRPLIEQDFNQWTREGAK